jgi:site-specific recombinase XerD
LEAFFKFVEETLDPAIHNLCNTPMLKTFQICKTRALGVLEKETVDEIIFRTTKPRDRLLLELMARGGMKIGEVVTLTPSDISGRKLTIRQT